MDRQKVLEKAIMSALNNGWKPYGNSYIKPLILSERIDRKRGIIGWSINETKGYKESLSSLFASENDIIYNQQFAKCLWGEDRMFRDNETGEPDETYEYLGLRWQHHLQQMVVADDPLDYLAQNMPQ